jgi:hypothetical protein
MGISKRRVAAAVVGAAIAVVGTTSVAGAAAPSKFQVVVTDDFSSGGIKFVVATIPAVVESGTYKVGLANNSIGPHVLIAAGGLPEGITVEQFSALIDANPGGPPPGVFDAGAVFSKPGQDHQKIFDLTTPGQYGFFCPIQTPSGVPHYKLGFIGLFDVAAAS